MKEWRDILVVGELVAESDPEGLAVGVIIGYVRDVGCADVETINLGSLEIEVTELKARQRGRGLAGAVELDFGGSEKGMAGHDDTIL